jgi:transcriptional regulator with XRE-family HTH domain
MSKRSEQPVVAPAPPEQRIGKPQTSSGRRGKPLDYLLARIEAKHPGIEEEIGLSSAAVRAGRQVREMRQAKGWTQVQLAQALGWDQVRISNIERGEGPLGPTFDVLQRIAAVCDYDIEFKPREQKDRPFRYADILRRIAQALPHSGPLPGTMVPSPQFAAACVAFTGSMGAAVQTYFRLVEKPLTNTNIVENDTKTVGSEMSGIPYIEMGAQGKRMVMLPVLVEDSGLQIDADAKLDKKTHLFTLLK